MPNSRRVCNHASFLYVFLLSLRWRAQLHSCASSSKIKTIRFCDTSKGIRPVLRSSCSTANYNYNSQNGRSRARGVVNVHFDAPALRAVHFFLCFSPCVALAVSHFSTPLRRRACKFHFSVNSQMIRTCLENIDKSGFNTYIYLYIKTYTILESA